jgi:hypothetical protein
MDNQPFRFIKQPKFDLTNRVTREMVRTRTVELARRAGREPSEVMYADYVQAKEELTGESDLDRQEARMDSAA